MLRSADEGEGLTGQHGVGMTGAGLDGHDLDRNVFELVFRHADIER